jgi:hypothetical protein
MHAEGCDANLTIVQKRNLKLNRKDDNKRNTLSA